MKEFCYFSILRCKGRLATIPFLLVALLLGGSVGQAAELLQNGNFNSPLAGSWTAWATGGGWEGTSTTASEMVDGTQFIYMGGNDGDSAGMYQEVFGVQGVLWTFAVDCAINSGWGNPPAEMRLEFLDATETILLAATNDCSVGTTDGSGLPWTHFTLSLTSPSGTAKVKVELVYPGGRHGTIRWDNASLTAPLVYPTISGVYPDGALLMQPTNKLVFTAASTTTTINPSGIQLVLNGVDVSASLTMGGTAQNRSVSYTGLQPDKAYSATIQVVDAAGLTVSKTVKFDTYSPANYTWEAEDYDYNSGLFIDNPQTNAYYGLSGTAEVDMHETSGTSGNHDYRTSDLVGTEATADVSRIQYAGTNDFNIGWFDAGEWLNYTRTFPAGVFNVYARMASPGSATITLSRVTSGQGTTSQTTVTLGTFPMNGGQGWGTYTYVPLVDANGNLVKLSLSGKDTLRITTGGNCNAQFFMLVPANTSLPTLDSAYPNGSTLFQATNKLSFTASSAAGINTNSIRVALSVTNLALHSTTNLSCTNGLVMTGTSTSRIASYTGLVPNALYTAVITVTDINNNTINSTLRFDTYNPVLTWEAEDYDYNSGQFINNPAVDAYANLTGTEGVDYHDSNAQGNRPYRPGDTMSSDAANDTARIQYLSPSTNDYSLGYFTGGEWVNYTRTFPAGTYNVYGRFAAGGGTSGLSLSKVTNGGATVQSLGNFSVAGTGGWSTYGWTPLRDQFNNLAQVALNGSTTLRLTRTSGADANVNFLMILPAENDLPTLSGIYPDGTVQLQATNTFSFSCANPVAAIYSTNINLTLNGVDVSSQLQLAGSPSGWNATLPIALNMQRYTAAIRVRDANNNVATTTIYFDTFNPNNFVWEAEDYDFTLDGIVGGHYINNPDPTSVDAANSYFNRVGLVDGDYHLETTSSGAPYLYRPADYQPTDVCGDYPPLQKYVTARLADSSINDYNLGYWTSNSWANYTRDYPAGTYYVFGRLAGGAAFNIQVDQVSASATNHIGQLSGPGWGWGIYSWWPMVDTNGALVTLSGGLKTLRLTTDGNANANRYMLVLASVPTANIITATLNAGNIVLSFPTESSRLYQVFYKSDLSDATWTLLKMVSGNGSTMSISDPATGAKRFYRLSIQ